MRLRKTFITRSTVSTKRGFTLLEMLVVIGVITVISAVSLFVDMNSFRGEAFRGEASAIVVALQTARADALNNIHQEHHGVAFRPGGYDGYVIFEGDSYAAANHSKDEFIKSAYNVTLSAIPGSEIVFSQLSGNANYDGTIVLTDPSRGLSTTIDINHEGQISW